MGEFITQAFIAFADQLSRLCSPLPPALVLGALFLPLVAAFRFGIWALRCFVLPVQCCYFHTTKSREDKSCRVWVPGEWRYCWHHSKRKTLSNGHEIDPTLQRWEKKVRGVVSEREDMRGLDLSLLFSSDSTLFFYRGFARRPMDVLRQIPISVRNWRTGWVRVKAVRLADLVADDKGVLEDEPPAREGAIAESMERIVPAARFIVLRSLPLALLSAIGSMTLPGDGKIVALYVSFAMFTLSWDAFRFAFWKTDNQEPRWKRTSVRNLVKTIAVMAVLALSVHAVQQLQAAGHRHDQQNVGAALAPPASASPRK